MASDTIVRWLSERQDLAYDGVPANVIMADPEWAVYVRALRLKRFNWCPHCDEKVLTISRSFWRLGWQARCGSCEWWFYLWKTAEYDPDDLILDIVRGAMP